MTRRRLGGTVQRRDGAVGGRRSVLKARAYLMFEVMVGGAMSAVIIVGIISSLSHTHSMRVVAGRDTTASQLALVKMEELRRASFPPTTAGSPESPVPGVQGRYTRSWTVSAVATESITPPALGSPAINNSFVDISVTVSFPSNVDSSPTRTTTISSRTYQ